jgi:DNA-binding NarL/FixJ family response regulator
MAVTVLVVDDDPGFRGLAARVIGAMGLTVAGQAENADQALAAAQRLRPDAALVDVRLPDRDGIDLAVELAALPWHPRVVLISSDPDTARFERDRRDANHLAFVSKEDLPRAPLRQLLTSV